MRAGRAHIHNVSRKRINHDPRPRSARNFNHGRPVSFQIEKGREVNRPCIAGEKQRIAVHQSVKDNNLVGRFLTKRNMASPAGLEI